MDFRDIIDRHKDFLCSCAAISLGTFLGMTGTKLIQSMINNRVLENCPIAKIASAQDFLIGERLFCVK